MAEPGGSLRTWSRSEALEAVERVAATGEILADGVRVDGELLARMLEAAPRAEGSGAPVIRRASFRSAWLELDGGLASVVFKGEVDFRGATLAGGAIFADVRFNGGAEFWGARFEGDADFGSHVTVKGGPREGAAGATFGSWASFREVTFAGRANFSGATFEGAAFFDQARFEGPAGFFGVGFPGPAQFLFAGFGDEVDFTQAQFAGDAGFQTVTIKGDASFRGAHFGGRATFGYAHFRENADFDEARFTGDLWLYNARFDTGASFERAVFDGGVDLQLARCCDDLSFEHAMLRVEQSLGPFVVDGRLVLDGVDASQRLTLRLACKRLTCLEARLRGGATMLLQGTEVALDGAEFGAPSILGAAAAFKDLDEEGPPNAPAGVTRLLSVRGTDVGRLRLAGVDLHACRFADARYRDQLEIGAGCTFARAPRGILHADRDVLAEEHEWRHGGTRSTGGWYGLDVATPPWLLDITGAHRLEPAELAPIYRELRKGIEDRKNEPGAADLYYGEMEMRRHAARRERRFGEWTVLSLYWLLAGYGLRGSRALLGLIAVVTTAAALLWWFGLRDPDISTAVLQAIEGATLRTGERDVLTEAGSAVQLALRLLGPVLFGLALLSLRGRVKR